MTLSAVSPSRTASRFSDQYESAGTLGGVDPSLAKEMAQSGLLDGDSEDDKIPTSSKPIKSVQLNPSQTTLVLKDVVGLALEMLLKRQGLGEDLGALVSSDRYIMDGHHRWAGSILAHGPRASVKVWLSSLPGKELVRVLNIVSKGAYGVTSGNTGTGSINDLTPANVRRQLETFLREGRQHKHFSPSAEQVAKILETNFGSVENGVNVLSERAKLIPKAVPSWAPVRDQMPVIRRKKVQDAAKLLTQGVVDWAPPYSDSERMASFGSASMAPLPVGETSMRPDPTRVAARYASQSKTAGMVRTAGEVRFIKDRSGDAGEWAFGPPGPSERDIQQDFVFNAKHLKPLAQTLRSALMALGHVTSAYNKFVKIKSRNVSPDGSLGGKGYIQKIPDMRRQLMNCVEALSALTDTIYDEMTAPHWNPTEDTLDPRDREEVKEIIEDAEEIKDDPEAWASGQEEELDAENEEAMGKTARRVMLRYANRRLA